MTTTTRIIAKDTTKEIQGPAGKLELLLANPTADERGAFGIVCHPHPLFGGTMQNKVVTTLAKTFQELGLHTIRFNFRGVGKSEGEFNQGIGELQDLLAVIRWVMAEHKDRGLWLAGFSFGAYVATCAATLVPTEKLVTVAPPVESFPMHAIPKVACPWVLVQGEKDEVVSPRAVFAWAESRQPRPTILRFPEAGHFFHGQLTELRMRLEEALNRYG